MIKNFTLLNKKEFFQSVLDGHLIMNEKNLKNIF